MERTVSLPELPLKDTGMKKTTSNCAAVTSCVCWSFVSSGLVLLNKYIMSDEGFDFPMALSCLGMMTSSFLSWICMYRLQVVPRTVKWSQKFLFTCAFPVGLCSALTLYLGNLAYLYLSVAYIQILKGTTPIATLAIGVLFGGVGDDSRCTTRLGCSLIVISLGVFLASYADLQFSIRGFLAMVASVVFEAVKVIAMQKSMLTHKLHALEALSVFAPPCALCLGLGTLLLERDGLERYGLAKICQNPSLYIFAGSLGFVLNLLVLWVIKAAGSVTFKVVAMLKNVLTVLGSVILFNASIAPLEAFGYTLSLVGFYAYHQAKLSAPDDAPQQTPTTKRKVSVIADDPPSSHMCCGEQTSKVTPDDLAVGKQQQQEALWCFWGPTTGDDVSVRQSIEPRQEERRHCCSRRVKPEDDDNDDDDDTPGPEDPLLGQATFVPIPHQSKTPKKTQLRRGASDSTLRSHDELDTVSSMGELPTPTLNGVPMRNGSPILTWMRPSRSPNTTR